MSAPLPDPSSTDAPAPSADQSAEAPAAAAAATRKSVQRSRVGAVWVGGYFDAAVMQDLKALALQDGTTVQALIGRALNDLLERAGRGRPASEAVLPRGGAAHSRGGRRRS
jgi:hypothetical protein